MSEHRAFVLSYSSGRSSSGWAFVLGCGVVVGFLLGVAITGLRPGTPPPPVGDPDLEKVPVVRVSKPTGTILAVAAGMIIGAAGALVARSHPRLAALTAGAVASISSVATIVLLQWRRGRWPIASIDGRMFAVAAALVLLVCSAALLAAFAASVRYRRAAH